MKGTFHRAACKAVRGHRISSRGNGHVPNAETVAAIREVERMKEEPGLGKSYSDVEQMMEELLWGE